MDLTEAAQQGTTAPGGAELPPPAFAAMLGALGLPLPSELAAPTLDPRAVEALRLLAAWTAGKPGESDEILCALAVQTVATVIRLTAEGDR